jgi:hypothetical protein
VWSIVAIIVAGSVLLTTFALRRPPPPVMIISPPAAAPQAAAAATSVPVPPSPAQASIRSESPLATAANTLPENERDAAVAAMAKAAADTATLKPLPSSATKVPPFVCEAKALIREGNRRRMRDARVVLADGKINVQAEESNRVLYAIPYENVISISYSAGRDPMFKGPTGAARVARADGGVLGIFRFTRYWVSVRTTELAADGHFVPLLFATEEQAKRAVGALEERTGRTADMLAGRSGD